MEVIQHLLEAEGKNETFISRIREDKTIRKWIKFMDCFR